jgi:hypothetical protein
VFFCCFLPLALRWGSVLLLLFCLKVLFWFAGSSSSLSCQFWRLGGALLALVFFAGILSQFYESAYVLLDGAVPA